MKGARFLRWSPTGLPYRTRQCRIQCWNYPASRSQATAAAPVDSFEEDDSYHHKTSIIPEDVLTKLPSPPVGAARTSAKLSTLHARLSLPSQLPVETLARTLVDPSADESPKFNNKAFSVLGNDLLAYYTAEYILSQYPRLPLPVVYAAMYAYVGPKALAAITREWGVERVAEPGGEVDPGYLQFRGVPPQPTDEQSRSTLVSPPRTAESKWRRGWSSRTVYDNEFGDRKNQDADEEIPMNITGVTLEQASANFVRALTGAVFLHGGRPAAKQFYQSHFMSRSLNMAKLFQFKHPTKDLSRLCAREGFQAPVARIESETGRKSRHPVFVVGVYSGNDKLGEGVGASLDEARITAAVAALKGWYLYSPLDIRLPSEMEEPSAKSWEPLMVDQGEIVT